MSIRHETNHKVIVVSFYHAMHAARLIQRPSKKEEVVSFSSAMAKRKKPKKLLSSD